MAPASRGARCAPWSRAAIPSRSPADRTRWWWTVSSSVPARGPRTLLRPFGLKVPLEAARGYHLEMPGATPLIDAPDPLPGPDIFVTPMAGRLRSTSFMEFSGAGRAGGSAPSGAIAAHAASRSATLPTPCSPAGWARARCFRTIYRPSAAWPGTNNIFYAFGHQHIGLTLSAMTAQAVADLVAGQADVAARTSTRFDLRSSHEDHGPAYFPPAARSSAPTRVSMWPPRRKWSARSSMMVSTASSAWVRWARTAR